MAKKKASKKKVSKKVVVDAPAQKSAKEPEVKSEEASVRQGHSGKWHHRQRAHVPGPRRQRKFSLATPPVAEEGTVAEAPAEAEVPDEGVGKSNLDATGREKPMTLGSVDG